MTILNADLLDRAENNVLYNALCITAIDRSFTKEQMIRFVEALINQPNLINLQIGNLDVKEMKILGCFFNDIRLPFKLLSFQATNAAAIFEFFKNNPAFLKNIRSIGGTSLTCEAFEEIKDQVIKLERVEELSLGQIIDDSTLSKLFKNFPNQIKTLYLSSNFDEKFAEPLSHELMTLFPRKLNTYSNHLPSYWILKFRRIYEARLLESPIPIPEPKDADEDLLIEPELDAASEGKVESYPFLQEPEIKIPEEGLASPNPDLYQVEDDEDEELIAHLAESAKRARFAKEQQLLKYPSFEEKLDHLRAVNHELSSNKQFLEKQLEVSEETNHQMIGQLILLEEQNARILDSQSRLIERTKQQLFSRQPQAMPAAAGMPSVHAKKPASGRQQHQPSSAESLKRKR